MAKMIDQKPEYKGEAKFWQAAHDYLSDDVIIYHNREVKGREFDFCLLFENLGVLIVEVKGWKANEVDVKTPDIINILGYEKPQKSPKKQARTYRFNLLGEIGSRLNVNPVVLDMVCYPFISKSDFFKLRLDVVSEEAYTLFAEDLEDGKRLNDKIKKLFQLDGYLGKTKLDHNLVKRIRELFEVNIEEELSEEKEVYSELSIYVTDLSDNEISKIIAKYFYGVKTILFISSKSQLEAIRIQLSQAFLKHNLQANKNEVCLGYESELKISNNSVCTFNFEAYYVQGISEYCFENITVLEGRVTDEQRDLLVQLGKNTRFNSEQYFVEHASTESNMLVEAGAGTGKTFSMVSRIAYLCNRSNHAVSNLADEIAMVTFTNDAANNMKVRIKKMLMNYFLLTNRVKYLQLVEQVDLAQIATIHKFAIEILRKCSFYTGLGVNYRIVEDKNSRQLLYDQFITAFIDHQLTLNPNFGNEFPVEVYDFKKKIIAIADKLLNKSINIAQIQPEEFGTPIEGSLPYFNDVLSGIILPAEAEYNRMIHENNGMDLKECIMLLEEILKKTDEIVLKSRIRFLFVDEFQDTDDVQINLFQLIQKVIGNQCKFFVVGDLKQSIYRFRGANLSAFDLMKSKTATAWDTYHLTRNYRTDFRLLEIFDAVFSPMGKKEYLPYDDKDQLIGTVSTSQPDEQLMVSIPCHGQNEEQFYDTLITTIKNQIAFTQQLLDQNSELKREERTIALLVRSNWQVAKIVEEAEKREIRNIEIQSGGDLFELDSTLDLYKLVLAMENCRNPVYLTNFIESNYTPLRLDYARYKDVSEEEKCEDLIRILNEFCQRTIGKTWDAVISSVYSDPILFVLKQLYDAFAPWKNYSSNPAAQLFYTTNYEYLLERIVRAGQGDAMTLNGIAEYLKINILTGQKELSRSVGDEFGGVRVVCTTIHKSKGLEYGTVILPFTNDDISDTSKAKLDANYSQTKLSYMIEFENGVRERNNFYDVSIEQDEQIKEESRILYVAMTRAIRNLIWFEDLDNEHDPSWGSLLKESN